MEDFPGAVAEARTGPRYHLVGAYLWTFPVVLWLNATPAIPHGPLLFLPITVLTATISWWLVERPASPGKPGSTIRVRRR